MLARPDYRVQLVESSCPGLVDRVSSQVAELISNKFNNLGGMR